VLVVVATVRSTVCFSMIGTEVQTVTSRMLTVMTSLVWVW